jgi:uncharacterized membrane protein
VIRSILLGAVAGARAMTPLAAASIAANRGTLPENDKPVRLLGHPLVVAGTTALAAAEMGGDKMKSAPDRVVLPGILARIASASIAGAALAPRRERPVAAAAAALTAVGAAYLTWRARLRAMERGGRIPTGLVEDAIVAASAVTLARSGRSTGYPD